MEIKTNCKEFLDCLQLVKDAASPNNINSVLSNVLIRAKGGELTMIATNHEIQMTAKYPLKVSKDFEQVLPVSKLQNILRVLDSDSEVRIKFSPKFKNMRSALADLIGQANIPVHPEKIKEKVSQFYNIRLSDLSSKKRHHSISQTRHIAIYLCRQMTNLSLPEIGQHFGKRNHTTVLHSCRQVEEKLRNDKLLSGEIDSLFMSIKGA